MSALSVSGLKIPGLLKLTLPVHGDSRGWFKENWQRSKMVDLGLPDFAPVQNNISFNPRAGATRGLHAEPWDKLVSVASGRVLGAWVDLREGPSFGVVETAHIDPGVSVYVPRGVANGYQTLVADTAYVYLVNAHWSAESLSSYVFVNLADPELDIQWPYPLDSVDLSDADRTHPPLKAVAQIPRPSPIILGSKGQVGRALGERFSNALTHGRDEYDMGSPGALLKSADLSDNTVYNACGYTSVDEAESRQGREDAWRVNVRGLGLLVEQARRCRARLVHFSSDYVFDGKQPVHDEDENVSPLGVYGQTKAAGDALVATLRDYYIVRTSWVVGDGPNFVKTMAHLAREGVNPSVVDDQFGRLTFAQDLAAAASHLVTSRAAPGIYNVSGAGEVVSWADIAREVFSLVGRDPDDVRRVTTREYTAGAARSMALRPVHSALDLAKLASTGFEPADWRTSLGEYFSARANE